MILQILFTLLLLFVLQSIASRYFSQRKLINFYTRKFTEKGFTVKTLPISLVTSQYIKQIARDSKKGDCFTTVKKQYPQYDVVLSNTRNNVRIILINPKLIKEFVMAEKDFLLSKTPYARTAFSKLAKGILFSEKEVWRRKRRIVSNVFSFDFVTQMTPRIVQLFDQALDQCQQNAQNPENYELTAIQYTSIATSSVVMQCFLGGSSHEVKLENQKLCRFLINLLDDFVQQLIDPVTVVLGQNFLKMGLRSKDRSMTRRLKAFNQWSTQFIHRKIQFLKKKMEQTDQKNVKASDLIEAILFQNKKTKQSSDIYTEEEIIQEFKIFLLAGTDTTSNFLQVMLYYIGKFPEVQSKLRLEISTIPLNASEIDYEHLKCLKYLDAVMKQTIRIYGPANFIILRQAQKDFYLGDIPIIKGTYLNHMSMATHYSQRYYQSPQQFKPERWLDDNSKDLDPYAHIGFSAGSRSCIGRQLALLQAKIGVIRLLQRYKKLFSPQNGLNYGFKFAYVCQDFNIKVCKN